MEKLNKNFQSDIPEQIDLSDPDSKSVEWMGQLHEAMKYLLRYNVFEYPTVNVFLRTAEGSEPVEIDCDYDPNKIFDTFCGEDDPELGLWLASFWITINDSESVAEIDFYENDFRGAGEGVATKLLQCLAEIDTHFTIPGFVPECEYCPFADNNEDAN